MTTIRTSPQSEPYALSVQIWTVATLVRGKLSCSIHASEHDAYREAVLRFECVELGERKADPELRLLLKAARLYGNYLKVRQYIENIESQIQIIQLAEHSVYDLHEYVVKMPVASSTRRRSRRQSEVADHFAVHSLAPAWAIERTPEASTSPTTAQQFPG